MYHRFVDKESNIRIEKKQTYLIQTGFTKKGETILANTSVYDLWSTEFVFLLAFSVQGLTV